MKPVKLLFILTIFTFLEGCSTLKLSPADFTWPLESVIPVDQNGVVVDKRYSFSFNTKSLFFAETGDSTKYMDQTLRIIRDAKGYYYITCDKFTSVYVFKSGESSLVIENKILINEKGIQNPALNQRAPYIELIDGKGKYLLDNQGLKGDNQ
jgi:hypothetical protein